MRFVVHRFHPLRADVCINLGRTQIRMAEKLLHTAQIRSRIQKMRRKRVAEFVRRHVQRKTRGPKIQLEIPLKGARCQPLPETVHKDRGIPMA